MIAFLRGNIIQKTLTFLILEVGNGLGYKVFVTPDLLERPIGSEVELYTHLKSSDDGQTLFGMPDFPTLQFFEMLMTVSSVGPKMALTIVSAAKIDVLQQSIAGGDAAIFTRMSGVGKKTAERIILELKNKVEGVALGSGSGGGTDIYDALISLGYNPREVREVLPKVDPNEDMQAQLKQALKFISHS